MFESLTAVAGELTSQAYIAISESSDVSTIVQHGVERWKDLITILLALWATWLVIQRLNQQKGIARADLILKISKDAEIHSAFLLLLETYRKAGEDNDSNLLTTTKTTIEDTITQGRSLLRFYETLMLMLESKVLSDWEIFSLLAYRINLATSSEFLQKDYLTCKTREGGRRPNHSFCAVYALNNRMHKYIKNHFKSKFEYKLFLTDLKYNPNSDLKLCDPDESAIEEYETRVALNRSAIRRIFWKTSRAVTKWHSNEKAKKTAPVAEPAVVACDPP